MEEHRRFMPIFVGVDAYICFRSCLSFPVKIGMNFLVPLQRFPLLEHPLYSEGL